MALASRKALRRETHYSITTFILKELGLNSGCLGSLWGQPVPPSQPCLLPAAHHLAHELGSASAFKLWLDCVSRNRGDVNRIPKSICYLSAFRGKLWAVTGLRGGFRNAAFVVALVCLGKHGGESWHACWVSPHAAEAGTAPCFWRFSLQNYDAHECVNVINDLLSGFCYSSRERTRH